MEANLKKWIEENEVPADAAIEEVSFQDQTFPDNKVTAADWKHLMKKCENIIALSFSNCGIKKIEAIENGSECLIEVLDLTGCPLEDFLFLKSLEHLVSLTIRECKTLTKLSQLESALKDHASVKVIEFDDEELLGCKDQEELRTKMFEMVPGLIALNGLDKEGKEMEEPEEEDFDLEDLDLEGLTEEQVAQLMAGGELDDDEEEDDDDEEDEAAVEEPATKKQKK